MKLVLGDNYGLKAPKILNINVMTIVFAAVVLMLACATASVGVYYTFSLYAVRTTFNEENATHRYLVHVLDSLDAVVAEKTEMVEKLSRLETVASLSYGVSVIPPEVKHMGVGGRLTFSDVIKQQIGLPVEKRASEIENLIADNKRRADFLNSRLGIIEDLSKKQKAYFAEKPSILPAPGRVTSEFGARNHPVLGRVAHHEGIDISNVPWTPIKASADGIVAFSGTRSGYGITVDIIHRNSGYVTRYAHLINANVKVGDVIKRGDIIGNMGNTGMSTGTHLHYEVRKGDVAFNPRRYIIDNRPSFQTD